MKKPMQLTYQNLTVSGKIATGTTTLAKNLKNVLGWHHINTGNIQRRWDRKHSIDEHRQGAQSRPDKHELDIDEATQQLLQEKSGLIYEAWLSGYMARAMDNVFKVLVVCSDFDVIVDRVVNRENIGVQQARVSIQQREEENLKKWSRLYKTKNFWDPRYYNIIVDTYKHGPMETLGYVLDKLGVEHVLP